MKTGILMAMADDRRTGGPLTGVLPYDECLKEFKRRVAENDAPAGYPNLEIWTGKVKSRRIKSAAAAVPEIPNSPNPGESPLAADDSPPGHSTSPEANEATGPAPEDGAGAGAEGDGKPNELQRQETALTEDATASEATPEEKPEPEKKPETEPKAGSLAPNSKGKGKRGSK